MASVRKVRIPEGVKVTLEGTQLVVTGPKGQLVRSVRFPQVTVTCDDKEIVISTESSRKEITSVPGRFRGIRIPDESRLQPFPYPAQTAGKAA